MNAPAVATSAISGMKIIHDQSWRLKAICLLVRYGSVAESLARNAWI